MNTMPSTFHIPGVPAPFATKGEKHWKETLAEALPREPLNGVGLRLRFGLSEVGVWPRKTDVDNLCEPVFSVVINRLGWFGGRRPNLDFFWAEKRYEPKTGLELTLLETRPGLDDLPNSAMIFEGTYDGPFPKSATDTDVPEWLASQDLREPGEQAEKLSIHLRFSGHQVNIGDVATGAVKSLIDCLYPILGGTAGAPDDSSGPNTKGPGFTKRVA